MAASDSSRQPSNPTSTLLQDMLREKKAQTSRVKKTYDVDGQRNGLGDREVQSSPLTTSREKSSVHGRRISAVGARQPSLPKEMGLKEMEQHLSKINKQNFNLKLEVFHRRQRSEVLETKLEKLEALETDNAEMQSINEDLLLELEKRDVAIQEAVSLICELEAKIEEMGEAEMYFRESSRTPRNMTADKRTNDANVTIQNGQPSPDSAETLVRPDSSPTRNNTLSPDPENSARRIPSFLRENKKNTNVLRSLYSYDGSIGRPDSAFSGDGEEDEDDGNIINSPRLSLLSEGGFMSVYGDADLSDHISPRQIGRSDITEETSQMARSPSQSDQREARLQKWVEERNRPTTPTRAPSKPGVNDHFSSIGEVLEKVPSSAKENGTTAERKQKPQQTRSPAKSERKEVRGHQRRPSSPAFGGPMFGGAMLPPTPGTMSTATIAGSSTPSIVTEKSLLDGTPLPAKGYSTLVPDARPQSSDSNFAIRLGNALAAGEDSDREPESPPSHRSSRAPRPSLATSATETVFSGAGYAMVQPSRTLSYPSPTGRARRPSGHLSPTSEDSVGERSSSRSQNHRRSATATPTKKGERETQSRSPRANQQATTPTTGSSEPQADADPKLGRSASLRSKVNKISSTPNQSTHKSVASRLFRRSNSQSVQAPPAAPRDKSPSKPPVAQENSSGRHARLPRPTSVYGSSPIYGQRPDPGRPSSHRSEREHICDSHRNYDLSSLLPNGMLTDTSHSSSPRHRRHRR